MFFFLKPGAERGGPQVGLSRPGGEEQTGTKIRYYSTYNFIGERIDGYEEPIALLTREAARALKSVSDEMIVHG